MTEARSIATTLRRARDRGVFSSLDFEFATRLSELFDETSPEVGWAFALACRQESRGHVCADLPALAVRGLVVAEEGRDTIVSALPDAFDVDAWLERLRVASAIEWVADPAKPRDVRPLVLDAKGRLYLRRNYVDQTLLSSALRRRGGAPDLAVDWPSAEATIVRISPPTPASVQPADDAPDWARVALRTGLARPLCVVTGGPGTGKTTLVVRLIALCIEQAIARGRPAPIVQLLAPTGKAAAAMTASIGRQRESLDVSDDVREALPASAETIHRLLLRHTRRDAFGRARTVPLAADIVVVDEASMVDLGRMRDLFAICEDVGRIVLLGDPDQLASVESGAALAEICSVEKRKREDPRVIDFAARAEHEGDKTPRLADSIVELRTSHRFASGGAIGRLARAIRAGDADAVLSILDDPASPEVERREADSILDVRTRLIESVTAMQSRIEEADSPDAKLERLATQRVLCAHRGGPLGVDALCEVLDEAAAQQRRTSSRTGWWSGKLVLVTRNAPEQDLWNGDVGLVEETTLGLRALFPDSTGGVRSLSAGRLPAHESAIAMSVHKSQGSEFDVVDLVLGRTSSRLMTRELLYTGVTRARERLCIHASEGVIREAVGHPVERDSALAEWLNETES